MGTLHYSGVRASVTQTDPSVVAPFMFWLMLRNAASDGFVFDDPVNAGVVSGAGCVLASPSWENTVTHVTQDYVYNWTRDAAIVAIELAAGPLPGNQPLIDYVQFAQLCQGSGGPIDRGAFLIDGTPRAWTDQSDGPALRTLAVLAMYAQLDAPTQAIAQTVIANDLSFLLGAYPNPTFNLWEEHQGLSFFARSVQLRCFEAIQANTLGIAVPAGVPAAIAALQAALAQHWNGQLYQTLLPPPTGTYDPNIDIALAAVYGAVPVTDTKLLATAAQLRSQWADPGSPYFYPINGADQTRGIGPLLGRYPGDVYDGDDDSQTGDHPWALCTTAFAELHYRLAAAITAAGSVPLDSLSTPFFAPLGVDASTTPAAAATAVSSAGDRMLAAVLFHSDHFELSEQFDATTGFERSVADLSWSYASYLSAVRARTAAGA